jgi:hypothetical protein
MSVSAAVASRPESASSRESFHDHLDPVSPENDEARQSITQLDAAVTEEVDADSAVISDANEVLPSPPPFNLTRPKSFSLPTSTPQEHEEQTHNPTPPHKSSSSMSSSSLLERYDPVEGLYYRRPSYSAPNQNDLSKTRHRLRGATLPALLRRLTALELSTKDDAWAFLTRSRSLLSPVHLLAFLAARFFLDTYRPFR